MSPEGLRGPALVRSPRPTPASRRMVVPMRQWAQVEAASRWLDFRANIPGGSRRATGQYRHLSRLLRRPPARALGTAVIPMVHCRGLRWLTAPLSVSSWIRSAIGQSPGRSYA